MPPLFFSSLFAIFTRFFSAINTIAHKVLKTVFVLLSRQVPYQDTTVDYEALLVQRNAPRWLRQLKKYGYLPKAV